MTKTWKEKIGKQLLAHVKETTQRNTLREVKKNIAHQRKHNMKCFECEAILIKLEIKLP